MKTMMGTLEDEGVTPDGVVEAWMDASDVAMVRLASNMGLKVLHCVYDESIDHFGTVGTFESSEDLLKLLRALVERVESGAYEEQRQMIQLKPETDTPS
ncbi:MAG: hypothetical protein WBG86_17900 [Polyangiales bacterium]